MEGFVCSQSVACRHTSIRINARRITPSSCRQTLPTNIKHQPLRRRLLTLHPKSSHPTHDGTNEVDIENRGAVNDVKQHCNAQESQAPDPRHGDNSFSKRSKHSLNRRLSHYFISCYAARGDVHQSAELQPSSLSPRGLWTNRFVLYCLNATFGLSMPCLKNQQLNSPNLPDID